MNGRGEWAGEDVDGMSKVSEPEIPNGVAVQGSGRELSEWVQESGTEWSGWVPESGVDHVQSWSNIMEW